MKYSVIISDITVGLGSEGHMKFRTFDDPFAAVQCAYDLAVHKVDDINRQNMNYVSSNTVMFKDNAVSGFRIVESDIDRVFPDIIWTYHVNVES